MTRPMSFAATLLVALRLAVGAQCPDGAPPPCRAARTVAVAPKHVDPPLDDRTWIVIPFDNLSKAPDVDWLRDASVNLLYLDLSKWVDIKVVDDERVADLLRAVPEAQGAKTLSLAAGLAVAKRAGAGRLVMGDVLKIGARTTVTAKVFDVRNGQRIRTTNQEAPVQDSLMPAFGKLARGILNVAPPEGANVGAIGTTNTAAYQDYLDGVKALNRFDLKTARAHLEAALKLDSTFALAHYKLAVLIGWQAPGDPVKVEHAKAAARFNGTLPSREKALVTALLALNNQEYGRSCVTYGGLVRADSTDVDALYGMGECLWHDNIVEFVGGDSSRVRFRGSWNSAIRVFTHALAVDPTFHLAFQHILDSYTAESRAGCRLKDTTVLRLVDPATECANTYNTAFRRDGDSLLMVPVSARDVATLSAQRSEARRTNARHANIQKAREIAKDWVEAGPAEPRALSTLARIDLLLGNVTSADTLLSKVRIDALEDAEAGRAYLTRIEIDLKLGRATDFTHVIDSLAGTHVNAGAVADGLADLGRVSKVDSIIKINFPPPGTPPAITPYFQLAVRVVLGGVPDSVIAAERAAFDLVAHAPLAPGVGPKSATMLIAPTLMFGLRLPRTEWPAIDSVADARLDPARALARKDTSALRAAALALQATAKSWGSDVPDDGSAIIAADAFLVLRDSTAALATIQQFMNRGILPTPMFASLGSSFVLLFTSNLWPRAQLMLGDLEAAVGSKADARKAYRTFIAFWTKADPEFQPMVEHARQALAALGPG